MSSQETCFHPSGRLPSPEEESLLRFGFLGKDNPILKDIKKRLRDLELKGKRNLPLNLLAFYYGVCFYNQISRYSLFPKDGDPPINIIRDQSSSPASYVVNNRIHIDVGSFHVQEDFYCHPLKEIEPPGYPTVTLPAYLAHIIFGIEEASHLHLDRLHRQHSANSCSRSDHRFPSRLWRDSDINSIAYRAKLWHEFAALVVQKAYLNCYIAAEAPETVQDFNQFYDEVVKVRRRWIRRKDC